MGKELISFTSPGLIKGRKIVDFIYKPRGYKRSHQISPGATKSEFTVLLILMSRKKTQSYVKINFKKCF